MTADHNETLFRGLRTVYGSRLGGVPSPERMGRAAFRPRNLAALRFRTVRVIEEQPVSQPVPIWASALLATPCLALGNGRNQAIQWESEGGRMMYTNTGLETEWIEALKVSLPAGETLIVSWVPGDTAYTLEVSGRFEMLPLPGEDRRIGGTAP